MICNKTADIANGHAVLDNKSNRKVGATATVVCEYGYTTKKESIMCFKSGEWEIASCSRIVCEKTVDIANGRAVLDESNNIELGATATVTCDEGYKTKNKSIMCLESGEWEISNCSKINNKVLDCDFEILDDKSCKYETIGKARYAWTRNNGQTNTWYTGPTADHTRGKYWGHYLYLESNAPADYQDIAKLRFDPITGSEDYCFTLWYHMYGSHIDYMSISLEDTVTNGMTEIIRVSGDQGNKWHPAGFKITADNVPNDFMIVIEAQRGQGVKSDYAIDDLIVSKGSCADCGFVPGVANGKVRLVDPSNSEAGAEATVSCKLGYRAETERIKCLINGEWETPVCSVNDCGQVPIVENGNIVLDDPSSTTVGATASVSCNYGYEPRAKSIRCLRKGLWEEPNCKKTG
ncbi:MAM and LDL-receptor class A domain-containing protein 1-like [Mercenaria mercenaria]|uniref:MAM and LDL-receptor class A domain-containing protein 1-like n=1 Tax=Mercenaria mercenaria TaxID=6596 RepID=UPI00234FA689|nr:MAM and LDL-receptor class A domain-containing protein 1-like [Mercenaria mercenaria]